MQRLNADKYKPVLFADGEVGEIGGVSFGVITRCYNNIVALSGGREIKFCAMKGKIALKQFFYTNVVMVHVWTNLM